ncbi:MAG: hypothetical protein FWE67_04425, partial [Planctomycetaceae bacterium]|nr:hypothetical protein [Planctomycetaceae bacterium]
MKYLLLFSLTLFLTFAGAVVFAERPDLMTCKDEKGERREVKTEKDWETRRQEILAGMQEVMGPLPDRNNLPPL